MTYLVVNMWMCKKTTLLHLDEKNRKNRAVGGSHILKGVKCVKNPDPSIWIKIRSVVPVIHGLCHRLVCRGLLNKAVKGWRLMGCQS
jgi:hypothetical protein